jgi:hypothetical protein
MVYAPVECYVVSKKKQVVVAKLFKQTGALWFLSFKAKLMALFLERAKMYTKINGLK